MRIIWQMILYQSSVAHWRNICDLMNKPYCLVQQQSLDSMLGGEIGNKANGMIQWYSSCFALAQISKPRLILSRS